MTPPTDPTSVACPDCQAPRGEPCRMSPGWPEGSAHATRIDSARLRDSVTPGTCTLCGRPAVKGQRTPGGPVIAWHPNPEHHDCPPLPDPQRDWNSYAAAINSGMEPGVVDPIYFRPTEESLRAPAPALTVVTDPEPTRPLCPECQQGKVLNCAGQALDGDDLVPCANAGRSGQ